VQPLRDKNFATLLKRYDLVSELKGETHLKFLWLGRKFTSLYHTLSCNIILYYYIISKHVVA